MSAGDEKVNTACNALGEAAWGFGWGLGAPLTVLPLLIQRLGGSQVEIGLIAAIAAGGTLAPQIFSSLFLQRGVGRKWFLIIYHWAVMLPPWLGIAAVVFFLGSSNAPAARGRCFSRELRGPVHRRHMYLRIQHGLLHAHPRTGVGGTQPGSIARRRLPSVCPVAEGPQLP